MDDEVKGPAPAQPVSAEAFWYMWYGPVFEQKYSPSDSRTIWAFARAFAAQQNASLREELERAKKELADSRINHIDANQRNIRAVARAEAAERMYQEQMRLKDEYKGFLRAAEAELAEARQEIQDAKTYMIDVGEDKQHHWHGKLKTWVHEFGKLSQRKLPSAEGDK